jgi:hypothetical protein
LQVHESLAVIPITDLYLEAVGPNQHEVVRIVAALLKCNYLNVVRQLKNGRVYLASGERSLLAPLVKALTDLGATVTWEAQHIPGWNSNMR